MRRRERPIWTARCLCLIAVLLIVNTVVLSAATEEDLAKLKPGMTKAEVIQQMGKADSQGEKKSEDLCGWLTYKNVGRYKYVNVWFDCQDKLVAIDKASK